LGEPSLLNLVVRRYVVLQQYLQFNNYQIIAYSGGGWVSGYSYCIDWASVVGLFILQYLCTAVCG